MQSVKITPLQHPINTAVTVPGSLSYTIRALALAAMTKGSVKISNPLKSDDTIAMVKILQTLGITVIEENHCFIIQGDISQIEDKEYELNIQLSGRTARIMLAFLCIVPGTKIVICHPNFEKRPIGDLVDGLRQLGAKIEYLKQEGFLPVKINSNKLNSGTVTMKGNLSSQYISALLMIAPLVGDITIEVVGEQASKPFIDVTIDTMKSFGVTIENQEYKKYVIKEKQEYQNPEQYEVESDATAASYFWAIAAITKSTIKVLHITTKSKQGDMAFIDILEKMGCSIEKNDEGISITGTDTLKGLTVDMNDTPDIVPSLAVVAAFAKGTTTITGLEHLKIKESDRIEAPKNELLKLEITAKATNESLTIHGGQPHGTEIKTYGDHRMAMAFAVAGTKIPGIEINNPEVVNKSFPNFWEKLEKIGVKIQ